MENALQITFNSLLQKFTIDEHLIDSLWKGITIRYSSKTRHYHNLTHIESMLLELNNISKDVEDIETMMVSIFYHDIIYKATKSDNETQSALYMQKEMQKTSFTNIKQSFMQIEATKHHQVSNDNDINILLDLDLAILGQPHDIYHEYTLNIRKEYSIYPTFIYNKGRIKALEQLHGNGQIFKTEHFQNKYEETAKENIKREIETLIKN